LELREDPSTRKKAYEILERESGKSRNSLRVAFHKEGMTNRRESVGYSLPPDFDQTLVVICLVNARQRTPLKKADFLMVASKLAKKENGEVFSSSFFNVFLKRHKGTLIKSRGKVTSKTRNYEDMLEKTQAFIDSLDEIMATHVINNSNTVVFDETIINDGGTLPIVSEKTMVEPSRNQTPTRWEKH